MKAQGNQLTKLKVKEIVLTHPIEGKNPWPEESKNEEGSEELSLEALSEDGEAPTMEWDVTPGEEDQPSLFEEGTEE